MCFFNYFQSHSIILLPPKCVNYALSSLLFILRVWLAIISLTPNTLCVCNIKIIDGAAGSGCGYRYHINIKIFGPFLQGVLCYDFCHELDILATGSMDHTVRLWNPYVPSKPVAQLTVHTTSILDVVIAKDMGLIFSYSQDSVSLHSNNISRTDFLLGMSEYLVLQ